MRRKDLIATTMALTLSIFMASVCTGCGGSYDEVEQRVESGVSENTVVDEGYKVVEVEKLYDAMVKEDCSLLDSSDAKTEIMEMLKESYVTVYGEVFKGEIATEYYAVELDDGTKGFIAGENLDFNVVTLEDYSDNLVEIEGGDGEEAEEEVIEETTEETVSENSVENTNPYNIVDCDPVTKYTNTGSNIRAIPAKDGELVDTVAINTELTVTGTTEDGSWSRIEHAGMVCFIKSSLLSDSKTKVEKPKKSSSSSSSSGGTAQAPSTPAPSGGGSSGGGSTAGGPPKTGVGSQPPIGTKGADCSNENWGGVY